MPAVGLIVTSTCFLCLCSVLLCDIPEVLEDTILQMVNTKIHDGSAVDTFHCDTAMLLWHVISHFEMLCQAKFA